MRMAAVEPHGDPRRMEEGRYRLRAPDLLERHPTLDLAACCTATVRNATLAAARSTQGERRVRHGRETTASTILD